MDVNDIPATVRAKAVAADATRWLRDLPSLVADLATDWSIGVGRAYGDATEAYVAEAVLDDGTAIWEWGVVERVSTGLVCATIGLQPVGRQMLSAADRIATG